MSAPEAKPPTPAEMRDATIWRILRAIYLRLLARDLGRPPVTLSDAEASALLDPWLEALQRDFVMLRECTRHAHAEGVGELSAKLQDSAVQHFAGHELLDQVLHPDAPEDAPSASSPFRQRAEAIDDETR